MAKITPLSLYIINRVKLRRLILGLSGYQLSFLIEHTQNYVNTVENNLRETQYSPHDYPILAEGLKCTVHDLLPPDNAPVSDGSKVDKIVLSLSNPRDVRKVIDGLIEYGFFKEPKTLEAIAKRLFIDGKPEILKSVLEGIVNDSALSEKKGLYTLR